MTSTSENFESSLPLECQTSLNALLDHYQPEIDDDTIKIISPEQVDNLRGSKEKLREGLERVRAQFFLKHQLAR